MMPIVIQLQAPVRYFPAAEIPVDTTPTPRDYPALPSHHALLLNAEDRWLRGLVSGDPHLNVLVQCSEISMASGFKEMEALCARPPYVCQLPGDLLLPDDAPEHLIVGDISTLTLLQQIALYDWLDRFGESVQVVSLTSVPLWPLVEQGRFVEGLFYRLNVVTLTAGPQ
jgi:hypothetical protein